MRNKLYQDGMTQPRIGSAFGSILGILLWLFSAAMAEEPSSSATKSDDIKSVVASVEPELPEMRDASKGFSVGLWVRADQMPFKSGPLLLIGDRSLLGYSYDGNFIALEKYHTPPLLLANYWHHVACVVDDASVRIYVDGRMCHAESIDSKEIVDLKGAIAVTEGQGEFPVKLDAMTFLDRPLSSSEVIARFEDEREAHSNPIRIYPYRMAGTIVVQIDTSRWAHKDPLRLTIRDPQTSQILVEKDYSPVMRPDGEMTEVEMDISALPPGIYEVSVTNLPNHQGDGFKPVEATLNWPDRPTWAKESRSVKTLNNFVTELVNQPVAADGVITFENPRDGWLFFADQARDRRSKAILIDAEGKEIGSLFAQPDMNNGTFEAMRWLSAGKYQVRMDVFDENLRGAFVVRAIPELSLGVMSHSSYPYAYAYGRYDGNFIRQHRLADNMNMICSGPWDWADSFFESWQAQSKKVIGGLSVPSVPAGEVQNQMEALLARPLCDGLTFDEFFSRSESEEYAEWTAAIANVSGDRRFNDKTLYAYCAALYGGEASINLGKAIVEGDQRFSWERYISESLSTAMARRQIFSMLGDRMKLWEEKIPGSTERMLICPAIFSAPLLTADINPNTSFKVLLDMIFQHVANDERFWGVAGLSPWNILYADEEIVRWVGRLYRHYCIEGKTTLLSNDPYEHAYLQNGDFYKDLSSWEVSCGTKGSINTGTQLGFDRVIAQWEVPIQKDSYCLMTRDAYAPNAISQTIQNLVPGRLYSLRLYTRDPQKPDVRQKLPLDIRITPAEVLKDKSFVHVFQGYVASDGWLNFHRIVFRATAPSAQLSISDWQETDRGFFTGGKEGHIYQGGEPGQQTMIRFVQVEPYFHE